MTPQPNPAVARLTPEPSAPPVVSRHVSLAQELLVAAVGRQNAETARNMCHWVQGVGNAREESHEAFHYGNVCPYEAVAAVLSGQLDPRDGRVPADVQATPNAAAAKDSGIVRFAGWLTEPACGQPDPRDAAPTAAPVEEPQARAFLQCTYPPSMTLIASGREPFCTDALERWVSEHPLPQYTRAYVVTVAAETICEPGVGVYTVSTAQDGQR